MIRVPIFPLPETVFFPSTDLPLHLFEPRYRQMAEDVTTGDSRLVVVLLRPGWEQDYYGNPPVHGVATLGRLMHHEKLPDGRFNIVLRGIERVRLLDEDEPVAPAKRYRCRRVTPIPEGPGDPTVPTAPVAEQLRALWSELLQTSGRSDPDPNPNPALRRDEAVAFETLVNRLASTADLPPDAKQALLEQDDVLGRAMRLRDHLHQSVAFWRMLAAHRDSAPGDPRIN